MLRNLHYRSGNFAFNFSKKAMQNKVYSYRGVGVYKTQQKTNESRRTAVNYAVNNCIKELTFENDFPDQIQKDHECFS